MSSEVPTALALEAFRRGFAAGADPAGARRRTVVEPATHDHWRRGHADGKRAATAAVDAYASELRARASPR
jgi:hypothetical protein